MKSTNILTTDETKKQYILRNFATMKLFNYTTIPTIIQNYDNINFNVLLYNEYYIEKLKEGHRPPKLHLYSSDEISLMVKWGIYLIQEHAKNNLCRVPIPLDFNIKNLPDDISVDEDMVPPPLPLSQLDLEADEEREDKKQHKGLVMKNAKWNIHNKTQFSNNKMHLMHAYNKENPTKDLWIGDSGASCHFINTDFGMFDWKRITEEIGVGGGNVAMATKEGSVKLKVIQRNGEKSFITLTNVKFIKNLQTNLFSITTALTKGWTLSNRGVYIVLEKNDGRIIFDTPDPTTEGLLMTAKMIPLPLPTPTHKCYAMSHMSHKTMHHQNTPGDKLFKEIFYDKKGNSVWKTTSKPKHKMNNVRVPTSSPPSKTKTLDITQFHNILGHVNERILQQTARHYNYILSGTLPPCVHCTLANIHRMPLSKSTKDRATKTGERIFIDISQLSTPSMGGNKYWLLIVDDHTDYAWSYFLRNKSDTTTTILGFTSWMKLQGHPVRTIRCDNSGENRALQQVLNRTPQYIKFEFTAPSTPQQNGRVERKFAILYNYMRSMLNTANLPERLRETFWAEAAKHATDIINCLCTPTNQYPPYFMFFNKNPPFFEHLRIFGEITVIAKHVKFQSKMQNKGIIGIYLGHAEDHSAETSRYYNTETRRVIFSRDAIPMNVMYGEYFKNQITDPVERTLQNNPFYVLSEDDDDEEINEDTQQNIPPEINNIPTVPTIQEDEEEEEMGLVNNNDNSEEEDDMMPGLMTENEYQQVRQAIQQNNQQAQPVQQQQIQYRVHVPETHQPKLSRELRRLDGFFNPVATRMHQELQQHIEQFNNPMRMLNHIRPNQMSS